MIREYSYQQLLTRLTNKLNELLSKDGLYGNAPLIYRMNRKLEFPLKLLSEQVKSITSRYDLLLRALASIEVARFDAATRRVRLRYWGSYRVVVVTGIRKDYIEAMVKEFKLRLPRIIKISGRMGKYELECDSEYIARLLKRHIREKKKNFDLQEDIQYKLEICMKIRIVIEGEELYTLLVDSLFYEEYIKLYCRRKDFLIRLEEKPGVYEPIILQTKEYAVEQQAFDDEEMYSEDRTSTNLSETQYSRFYKELIETQEVSTQLTLVDQDAIRDLQESYHREVVQVYYRQPELQEELRSAEHLRQLRKKSTALAAEAIEPPTTVRYLYQVPIYPQPPQQKQVYSSASDDSAGEEIVLYKLTVAEPVEVPPPIDSEYDHLYSFEFIDDLFTHLTKSRLLMRPEALNQRKVDVAADDHGRKLFFDKLCERRRKRRPYRYELESP